MTLSRIALIGFGLSKGAFFLDLNSCSPGQKVASAQAVEAAGGRYVEAADMNPIGPQGDRLADAAGRTACAGFRGRRREPGVHPRQIEPLGDGFIALVQGSSRVSCSCRIYRSFESKSYV